MLYFGQLKGLSRKEARIFPEVLERVNLSDKANTQLDKLSGGQQQKIQLGVNDYGRSRTADYGRASQKVLIR